MGINGTQVLDLGKQLTQQGPGLNAIKGVALNTLNGTNMLQDPKAQAVASVANDLFNNVDKSKGLSGIGKQVVSGLRNNNELSAGLNNAAQSVMSQHPKATAVASVASQAFKAYKKKGGSTNSKKLWTTKKYKKEYEKSIREMKRTKKRFMNYLTKII
jgi:hypothetical protein